MKSLMGAFLDNIGDFLADFFMGILNLIPKFVYFVFAIFTSGIDGLQCIIRKLAGLDIYYSASDEAFSNVDPLTEFIYGILGIGNSAPAYKALNTVFWSLSIFALIALIVSTMIAIIKSHYSEDTAGTSPWKYIYTAIKAILTYAIIPLVVIIGMKLETFLLTTLDNITRTSGSEDEVVGIYGATGTQVFKAENIANSDEKSYIYYDILGFGLPTNNTTMGGMMFKAAAYNCNRVRTRSIPTSAMETIVMVTNSSGEEVENASLNASYDNNAFDFVEGKEGGLSFSGIQVFGNCPAYDALTTEAEKAEYMAYQIDYAFCNNLHLQKYIPLGAANLASGSINYATDAYIADSDIFPIFGLSNNVTQFSKYDVDLVFKFYNLWMFNYIVAFGGGLTIFGILLSIILGLMTRLVKATALFLVYPPLLGIAPMENFKAFKSWGQQMLQQILMAIGAIVGMNVVLLILPYLQNLAFFNIGVIDVIIQLLFLIVALETAKEFIGLVAGFVGGADAVATGDSNKEKVTGTLKKGATMTGKLAGSAGRVMGGAATAPVRVIKRTASKARARLQAAEINSINGVRPTRASINGLHKNLSDAVRNAGDEHWTGTDPVTMAAKKAMQKAKAEGKDNLAQKAAARQAAINVLKSQRATDGKSDNMYEQLEKKDLAVMTSKKEKRNYANYLAYRDLKDQADLGLLKVYRNSEGKYNLSGKTEKEEKEAWLHGGVDQNGKKHTGLIPSLQGVGKKIGESIDGASIGRTMANAFSKTVGSLGEMTGLDKTQKAATEIFQTSLTFKGAWDPKAEKKLEGDALQKSIADQHAKESQKQTDLLEKIAAALEKSSTP